MNRRAFLAGSASAMLLPLLDRTRSQADEVSPEVHRVVDKGLEFLNKSQYKDGHLDGANGQYPVAMTGLAGMAFLMEGSTLREGKYSDNVRRAVDYLLDRARPNGLISNPANVYESQRYTYAHGFATLFLSCVYGEEEDGDRRQKLEAALTKAVAFIGNAQTTKGGWGYLAKGCSTEGDDMDEGSTTATQLQALRAARNVGIPVAKEIIDRARKYLENSTTASGGVQYRIGQPGERPALTAAAIACGFSFGEYESAIVKKWIKSAQSTIGQVGGGSGRGGHDEYAHYYYSQAVYTLGEDRYVKLFPGTRAQDCLTWARYKDGNFKYIISAQNADGSWTGNSPWARFGGVYTTSVYLTILQLDKGVLPIYQR